MNLRFLKTEQCPECGCSVVVNEGLETTWKDREVKTHCNGKQWEYREFRCGHKRTYVPNFSSEEVTTMCQETASYKVKQELEDNIHGLGYLSLDIGKIKDIEKALKLTRTIKKSIESFNKLKEEK